MDEKKRAKQLVRSFLSMSKSSRIGKKGASCRELYEIFKAYCMDDAEVRRAREVPTMRQFYGAMQEFGFFCKRVRDGGVCVKRL